MVEYKSTRETIRELKKSEKDFFENTTRLNENLRFALWALDENHT